MSNLNIQAREAALLALLRVDKEGAYANLEAASRLGAGEWPAAESRLFTQLFYGALRHQASLDFLLGFLLKQPLLKLPLPIRWVLRLSLYQLLYLDKIPASAAVNEGVKLARKYGHQGTAALTNAVLRNYLRRQKELDPEALARQECGDDLAAYLSLTLSYPRWLLAYLLDLWPLEQVEAFCRFHNQLSGISIRTNTLRISRDQLLLQLKREDAGFGRLAPEAIFLPHSAGLGRWPQFESGLFQVQDEASMLAGHILGAACGSHILDLCAAPGGKATHIAQLTGDKAQIHAFDLYPHKVDLLKENCRRLGINSILAQAGDALQLPEKYTNWADYLLLDAPCSGLGVLGRRPDARWRKQPEDIPRLAALGRRLLTAADRYLRPGGILLFSTCTVTGEENEGNIVWFMENFTNYKSAPFAHLLPAHLPEKDLAAAKRGIWQLLPQDLGTEGFFYARMQKRDG
ncbi:MAG: 16S rRNA (cytosine(967)-C(5))-methyltransferase RsmB [Clostridiales bacterium]|nr:16S rRNA (cytosine(967)-C(5))-methyltransferase RsmB [Clostridiales bacterium]